MEDTRVTDRELQAVTMKGTKDTRSTDMTIKVDLSRSRPARNMWSENIYIIYIYLYNIYIYIFPFEMSKKIAPRVTFCCRSPVLSPDREPIQPFLSQALGLGLALIVRRPSSWRKLRGLLCAARSLLHSRFGSVRSYPRVFVQKKASYA